MAKNKAAAVAPVAVRQRIVRTVLIPARDLKANVKNFRRHGDEQRRDVAALLDGIGQVAPVIGRDMPDGSVELLDGHLRTDLADDREILVAVTDLNDAEAATVLAMLDYTASLATIDPALAEALAVDAKASGVVSEESWAAWGQMIAEATQAGSEAVLADILSKGRGTVTREAAEPSQFVAFSFPVTLAQESVVRDAVRAGKAAFSVETTGDAVVAILEEWRSGRDKQKTDGQ